MAECPSCRRVNDPDARFCGACGQPLSDDVEVLGVDDTTSPVVDVRVSKSGPNRSTVVFAIVGVAVAGLLAWSILASADSDGGDTAADAPTEDGEVGPDGLPHLDAPTTTTTVASSPTTSSTPESVPLGLGPLLGEPTGLSLMIGGDRALRQLDLDTGILTEYSRRGLPLAVSGDQLLLHSFTDGNVSAVPVGDPDGAPVRLGEGRVRWAEAVMPDTEPGTAWIRYVGASDAVFIRVDLASGEELERLDASALGVGYGTPFTPFGMVSSLADPALVSPDAGGVYERTSDGYARVLSGRLVAYDRTSALVTSCDTNLRCSTSWYERNSWTKTARPVPTRHFDTAMIVGGGRWLMTIDFAAWEPSLLDLSTGAVRDIGHLSDGVAVSPEGRFLAYFNGRGRLEIHDLFDETIHELTDVNSHSFSGLLFVENDLFTG